MIKPLFNLYTISLCKGYICRIVINLSSPSKDNSLKFLFRGLLSYIQLSNNHPVKLTFNPSMILLVKQYIGCFVNNISSCSIGKSSK